MFAFTPSSSSVLSNGESHRFSFENGYGASVVRNAHSYGASAGLYELAVIGQDGDLDYDTVITDDVLGHLSVDDVNALLARISAL